MGSIPLLFVIGGSGVERELEIELDVWERVAFGKEGGTDMGSHFPA